MFASTLQVTRCLELVGTPSPAVLSKISSPSSAAYILALPQRQPSVLAAAIPTAPRVAIELIEACLQVDPDSRPTADEALRYRLFETPELADSLTAAADYEKVQPPALFNWPLDSVVCGRQDLVAEVISLAARKD